MVELLALEAGARRPGARAAAARRIDTLFIASVRHWIAEQTDPDTPSWLRALRDPQIARVIALLHDRPADRWTVEALAREVDLSRSSLARRFNELVGEPPLTYLARSRVHLAAQRLKYSADTVDTVARDVGYTSEFAFNRAFARHHGQPPGRYHVDPSGSLVRLKVADAGVQALDDGLAEVAVAFTSNPQLSRPDIVTLRDDRHMISADHVVPVVRTSLLERYGPALRRRLDAVSRLLTTLQLRGLNQQVIDGRLPEAVGGEFVDSNALGGAPAHLRPGPRIVVGLQGFTENETLAYMYAEALRGAGFRVTVRNAGGLRPQTVSALRHGRIAIYPGYTGSLLGYLGGTSLKRALARIGAQPLALARAQDRNSFAMKADVARTLGISKLSDLARFWPRVARARATPRATEDALQGEQWAVAPGAVLNLPGVWKLSRGNGITVAVVDSGTNLDHPDLAPNIWTNFDEIPGNGIDDDHNGFVDDVHGARLPTSRSATPTATAPMSPASSPRRQTDVGSSASRRWRRS
jgi:glycine betaine/choline ABC-type transport system substrate-binding protein